jgi:hypothetical protein
MSEDHIGVQINGVLYVKFEDAKKLREGWDEADAEIEKLREALQTARRDALEEAARCVLIYFNNNHIAQNVVAAIRALGEKE